MAEPGWWGHLSSVLAELKTLTVLLAGVLGWVASIRWSKQFIAAKDEIIKSKDAEIASLKSHNSSVSSAKDETLKAKDAQLVVLEREIKSLKELTPMKIKEYFQTTKEMLEEYNNQLKFQLTELRNELEKKNYAILELESFKEVYTIELEARGEIHTRELAKLQSERIALQERIFQLEYQLNAPREKITVEFPKVQHEPTSTGTIQVVAGDDIKLTDAETMEVLPNFDRRIAELSSLAKGLNKWPSPGLGVLEASSLQEKMDMTPRDDEDETP